MDFNKKKKEKPEINQASLNFCLIRAKQVFSNYFLITHWHYEQGFCYTDTVMITFIRLSELLETFKHYSGTYAEYE